MADAVDLANLKARRTAIAAELAAFPSTKPDYGVDGQSVQWVAYRKSLLEEFKDLNELIQMLEPFELHIQGST